MNNESTMVPSIISIILLCLINLCFIATALLHAEAFVPSPSSARIPRSNCKQSQTQLTSLTSCSRRRDVLITITTFPLISFLPPIQPVLAKDESMNYQAVWYDPKHPNGYRVLYGIDNQKATLLQKDEPSDEEVAYPVKVISPGGDKENETKLIFDFNDNGTVEGTLTRNREGTRIISFDNNGQQSMWINKKFEGPIGVYRDSADPKRVIIIRQVKGSDCVIELRDVGGDITLAFTAKAGTTFTFNFPNKGKVTASFDMKRRSFTFDDGTVWSKY